MAVFSLIKYLFVWPHLIVFRALPASLKTPIVDDVKEMNRRTMHNKGLAYYLVNYSSYRNLFYFRVKKFSRLLRILLPEYKLFVITDNVESIGGGAFVLNHPYGTIINCHSIGSYFTVCQLTTIGNAQHGRNDLISTIGNNVSIGANVNIIGKITIGDNVIIGAGSVVVKDVPSNCVIAGNPARVLHALDK